MPDTPATPPVDHPIPAPARPSPLLPTVLTRPASHLWFWALPVALLLLLNLRGYWIVEGNMDTEERACALTFGGLGLANLLLALAMFLLGRRGTFAGRSFDAEHSIWGLPAVAMQVTYLWLAMSWARDILPATVTVWIYPPERFLFNQLTFAMVPLAVGALRLACARPPRQTGPGIAISLLAGIGAPVSFYLLVVATRSIHGHGRFSEVLFAVMFVGLGLAMFIGIVRALMLVLRAVRGWGETGERVAIVLVALAMPVGGLILNREIPFPVDLQTWEVYTLVGVNTVILLLASWQGRVWPRASLLLLSGSFPFTLYFFVVFLPYTPLSIFAVLALGAGFLVLTPTFLFTLHLFLVHRAWIHAAGTGRDGRVRLLAAALACALLLPGFFAVRALADRAALHAALAHLTEPVITGSDLTYSGSRLNLRRAIHNHREFKHGIYYPILSDAYAWLVFDSLALPDDTLDRLERTFFGTVESMHRSSAGVGFTDIFGTTGRARTRMPRANPPPRTVVVRALDLRTTPGGDGTTSATLALTLENTHPDAWQGGEYVQELPLPAGMVVNGFRLHIDGIPVPGRIFERKTALWVYSMIRDSERRDPGLLLYTGPESLELRVFPVNAGKPVTVEIDVLFHGAAAGADVDSPAAQSLDPAAALGSLARLATPAVIPGSGCDSIATDLERLGLPTTTRPAYVHVIIDRSTDNGFTGDLQEALRTLATFCPGARDVRITLAHHDVRDLIGPHAAGERLPTLDARSLDAALPCTGGFALDPALAHALRQYRDHDLDTRRADAPGIPPRPVVVILAQTIDRDLPKLPIARAWFDLAPDLEIHALDARGEHTVLHRATAGAVTLARLGDAVRCVSSERPTRFSGAEATALLRFWSPDDGDWLPVEGINRAGASTPWGAALQLHLRQQDHERSPGDPDHGLPALVSASRDTGILLASTSYIVVENAAQWRMLELSERQKLGQKDELEFLETPAPPALLVAGVFGIWIIIRRRRPGPRATRSA